MSSKNDPPESTQKEVNPIIRRSIPFIIGFLVFAIIGLAGIWVIRVLNIRPSPTYLMLNSFMAGIAAVITIFVLQSYPISQRQPPDETGTKDIAWNKVTQFVFFALLAIAAVGLVGVTLSTIPEGKFLPEIALTILLIAGIVALMAIFSITVAILAALGLSNRVHSFGMPEGTVRAVIALGLILIFASTSVFLYGRLRQPISSKISDVTQEQLADIPGEEIIAKQRSGINEAGEPLYDVWRQLEPRPASEDFAKQVLTTISTLVVAVAGFYFGTRAVAVAKDTFVPPTLDIIALKREVSIGKSLPIEVKTDPKGLVVKAHKPTLGSIERSQDSYYQFEYTAPDQMPDPEKADVELKFSLEAYPEEADETIKIRLLKPKGTESPPHLEETGQDKNGPEDSQPEDEPGENAASS